MTLIDSLEYYYNRDDQGNLRTQGESEPVDEPFGELDNQFEDTDDLERSSSDLFDDDEEITEDDDAYGDPDYKEAIDE